MPESRLRKPLKEDTPKLLLKKNAMRVPRWLLVCFSVISFSLLLFFSVTGLTLNHPGWLADQTKTSRYKGVMPAEWVKDPDTSKIAKLEIVEFLRDRYGIKGHIDDFAIDESECSLTFKGPGYTSDVFIIRETGEYDLSETYMGIFAVMNDLHKGRDSGSKWSWVIDISAILMIVISCAGIILILFVNLKSFETDNAFTLRQNRKQSP